MLYKEDSEAFYKLFPDIVSSFYNQDRFHEYIDKCIMNIALNCPIFNTHRLAAEYLDRYNLELPGPTIRKLEKLKKNYCSDIEYRDLSKK